MNELIEVCDKAHCDNVEDFEGDGDILSGSCKPLSRAEKS